MFPPLVNTINCNVNHQCAPDKQHPKYINPYLIMFGSAESLEPLNNPQCKQQMLDWMEGEMDGECLLASDATPAVPPPPPGSHPPVSLWHVALASLHNDEAALLLSPRIITCDRRTDAQFSGFFLWDFLSLFFFFSHLLCQDLSLAAAPPPLRLPLTTCIHRTDPPRAFQMNLMGFLQRGEKLRGFPSVCLLSVEIGFLWLFF